MLRVEVLGDDEVQNSIPEEFKAFVGSPTLIELGGVGSMEECLDKQAPIFRPPADHLLESGSVKLLPDRCGKILPGDETVIPLPPAAGQQTEDGFHNVAHIRFRLFRITGY